MSSTNTWMCVTLKSEQSLADTVQALQTAISVNPDVRIPLVLNYADRNNTLTPAPVLIVFGNPKVGTPLMVADPRTGIDLPLEFLVWEDSQGQVYITYNNPHFIAGRIRLKGQNDLINAIADALNNLSNAGASTTP